MRQRCTGCSRIWAMWNRINLVDRCLVVFLLVLLVQSACSLLIPSGNADSAAYGIDIIVRTSSAAIFGHFLSANFARGAGTVRAGLQKTAVQTDTGVTAQGTPVQKIGFSTSDEPMEQGGATPAAAEERQTAVARLQVVAAAGIGLFCLVTLLLFRNIPAWRACLEQEGASATVAQFRDFVSGCVGFLIGCPTCASAPKQP